MGEDAELVGRCLRGEQQAWNDLVERYARYVHAIATQGYRLRPPDAEDAFQEVFLRVYDRLDSLRDPEALRPWIAQLTRRVCLDRLAASGREEPTEEPTDVAFDEQPGAAIARAGSSAMGTLTSVRYRISVTGAPGGRTLAVDVRAEDTGDCTGTVAIDDGLIRIRGVGGEQWFKADEAAWRAAEPGQADDFIAAAGGHWVRDEGFEFANFCFFANVLGELLQDVGSGTWFAVGSDRVDGHDVVRVQGSSDGAVVVAAVRVDQPHYLASFERTDDSDGAVSTTRFSEFGDDVEVDAPAGDDVVDLSAML